MLDVVERENLFSQKLLSTHAYSGMLAHAHTNTCNKCSERPAAVSLASGTCPVLIWQSGVSQLLMEMLVNAFLLTRGQAMRLGKTDGLSSRGGQISAAKQ